MCKNALCQIKKSVSPRSVVTVRFESKLLDGDVMNGINAYMYAYILVYIASWLLLSFDGYDLFSNFTAVSACLNNIGPGLGAVGPAQNFSGFSPFSKLVLMFDMLAGRLELFPMLVLFYPRTWARK